MLFGLQCSPYDMTEMKTMSFNCELKSDVRSVYLWIVESYDENIWNQKMGLIKAKKGKRDTNPLTILSRKCKKKLEHKETQISVFCYSKKNMMRKSDDKQNENFVFYIALQFRHLIRI